VTAQHGDHHVRAQQGLDRGPVKAGSPRAGRSEAERLDGAETSRRILDVMVSRPNACASPAALLLRQRRLVHALLGHVPRQVSRHLEAPSRTTRSRSAFRSTLQWKRSACSVFSIKSFSDGPTDRFSSDHMHSKPGVTRASLTFNVYPS
jgi:hypothetical protein